MDKQSYVYILATKRNGTLYIGATTNLIERLWQHKNKVVKSFTSNYDVINLVYFEVHDDLETALIRERRLKKWNRAWKIELIEKMNPYWNDLYETIL